MEKIKKKVQKYLNKKTSVENGSLDENTPLLRSGLLDSLQLIQLIIWIEGETGSPVEVNEVLVNNDVTINSIVSYLIKNS